ncbi:hypothetical protein K504DRAFT_177009 [Pleomassaria siparia CBS 279.74]|uniref:Uncharacterized protein n=1 Tax=Pleomassaria siparia CBS 279.74 TaxID=1314801 RepID=A0A6G1JT38_9PLEO|nr:hypothetical protein K504DRAFT_177009 [Pleomassaria siparia CBS 279.74]
MHLNTTIAHVSYVTLHEPCLIMRSNPLSFFLFVLLFRCSYAFSCSLRLYCAFLLRALSVYIVPFFFMISSSRFLLRHLFTCATIGLTFQETI